MRLLHIVYIFVLSLCCLPSAATISFRLMKGFPHDEAGIEKGVSACYAGRIGPTLIMAGGCNFPDKPVAEGGAKRYYRGIYAARISKRDTLRWQKVGDLPAEAAYGVSVSTDDAVVCVGGNNAHESLTTVIKIRLTGGKAVIDTLPSLPHPMDNFTGALNGRQLLVRGAGGVYTLDMKNPASGWKRRWAATETLMQPVSAVCSGRFFVWGGFTPKQADKPATLRLDGTEYGATPCPAAGPVDEHGEKVFLGGACAVNLSPERVLAMGGVNKDVFLKAINNPDPGYLTHPAEWYRFNPKLCLFEKGRWKIIGSSPITARAGAAAVVYKHDVFLIGGELKPGIRTPDIYRITIKK